MSEIKDRLLEFISSKGLSVSEFERTVGLSNGAVSKTNNNIRKATINLIASAFPDFNKEWLINGEGEMLQSLSSYVPPRAPEFYRPSDSENAEDDYIPLLPVEAMAGTLQGFSEGVELANCRKIKSPVKGADWAIQISGDSMEPDYRNGSYLYIRKMRGAFIPWGHTMVVDTYDGVVVKNIYPIEVTEDYIEAKSINPKYPPFKIETSSILGFYRVLGGSFINSTV